MHSGEKVLFFSKMYPPSNSTTKIVNVIIDFTVIFCEWHSSKRLEIANSKLQLKLYKTDYLNVKKKGLHRLAF